MIVICPIVLPCLHHDGVSIVSLYMQYTCQTGWVIAHLCTIHVGVAVVVTRRLVVVQISGSSENLTCEQRALAYVTVGIGGTRLSNDRANDIFAIPRQCAVRFADNTCSISAVTGLQAKVTFIFGITFIIKNQSPAIIKTGVST